jgi:hypothetical protein
MSVTMAEIRSFPPVKLMCGIIAARDEHFIRAEEKLAGLYGPIDSQSARFAFDLTNYYEVEMGPGLKRGFISFDRLIDPSGLAAIKIRTNGLEKEIAAEFGTDRQPGRCEQPGCLGRLGRQERPGRRSQPGCRGRIVNLDPGYLTAAALIMATAKDFSHRIPLQEGIYGHLEFLFTKTGIRRLDWTYPDFAQEGYQAYFLSLRREYLRRLKARD